MAGKKRTSKSSKDKSKGRPQVGVRVDQDVIDRVARIRQTVRITRSELLRAALDIGLTAFECHGADVLGGDVTFTVTKRTITTG